MPSEIEVKLEPSSEIIKRLTRADLLGKPEILKQTSIYFDTEDRRLFTSGFTVRIRRTGEARIQTVKATGQSASLFTRSEWETPLEGDAPVLDHSNPLTSEFGSDLELRPMFDVEVERRIWSVEESGSTIEVALDQGVVISGERNTDVRELELELKDGEPKDLFVLVRKIEALAPVRFGIRSKAERGFSLIEAQKFFHKAESVHLDKSMHAAASFQAIAASCFRQFRMNEDILLRHRNAEALHQARVALRRLRSAFSLYKPLLQGEEPQRLKDELRWLAGVLGEARNLDVLLPKAMDDDLWQRLSAAREAAYDDALEALSSSRARALMLDFNEWLHCGNDLLLPDTEEVHEMKASDFAGAALDRMRKKLKKHGRALAEVDDQQRHEARKDAKKLRYAGEFFASLFDDRRGAGRHKRFMAAMEDLQDHLGALNDLASGPAVLEKHDLADHPARESVISHADKAELIDAAQAALDDVLDSKRFWR
ncbi:MULTISPECIES: CHAD domain-containing protein [unclassified Sinorhizobium]|uniref:CYTH and CHAD domain-containing protein n=1 Tax=unclassified Sinorhizobium TaxID=2613772 RepID=UPI003524EE5F